MKINKKQKELIKIFIFLFLLSFVVVNWNNVSWIFNYREVSGLMYDFFNPYQESDILVKANKKSNVNNPEIILASQPENDKIYPYTDKENFLEIPSIAVIAPLVIGENTDKAILEQNLNKGVVYYPGSVLPKDNGQIVILGHSSPPNWPRIKYDWVFTNINNLNLGDQIILYFNNRKYVYSVKEKNIIKPGQDAGTSRLTGKNNILTLISCWPPGKNYQRIAVTAELLNP